MSTPPHSTLRMIPLGGLGEVGMNCMALCTERDTLIVDCGVMFPDRDLGVDVIHPDFGWLFDRRDTIRGVVLTHGHEDHIGGLPYLLRELPIPVYGPRYALRLVQERLTEHELPHTADLRVVKSGDTFRLGTFEIEPFSVPHSIADATGLIIESPFGTVVHTGDFTLYPRTAGHNPFDEDRLRRAGKDGVRVLLSDSTNAFVDETLGDEPMVEEALTEIVGQAPGRVVVAMFASNTHRLRAVFRVGQKTGRKLCLLGRSVHTHTRAGTDLGLLPDPTGWMVLPEDVRKVSARDLFVVAAGTQGEPAAALSRIAAGTHPALELTEGDTVVLSSRIIPGNEQAVFTLINNLLRKGVRVCSTMTDRRVHASGHASRSDQKRMLDLVEPDGFIPIHGTLMQLERHAGLATEIGVADTLVIENGAIVEIGPDALRRVGHAATGRVHVDAGEEVGDAVLRDRALLAELGMAVVVIVVDGRGKLVGDPEIVTRGVIEEEAEIEVLDGARQYVREELAAFRSARYDLDEVALRERAQRALKRYFARRTGRRPLTYGVVVHRR